MSLLLIDLQDHFIDKLIKSSYDRLICRTLEEIERAKANDEYIFIINYSGYGPLTKVIAKALRGYKKRHTIEKQHDDGSNPLVEYLKNKKIKIEKSPKVGGVNTTCCVGSTVFSLRKKHGFDPMLIWGAVDDIWDNRNEQRFFIKLKNFKCKWK